MPPPVFLCSLSLPSATLTPTASLHLPFSPFVSYLRKFTWAQCSGIAQNCLLQLLQTTWPSLFCFLCQLVPFVSSTSTYPGPTPSPHHGLYLCLEFPFPKLCPKEHLPIGVLALKIIFCMSGTLLGASVYITLLLW